MQKQEKGSTYSNIDIPPAQQDRVTEACTDGFPRCCMQADMLTTFDAWGSSFLQESGYDEA